MNSIIHKRSIVLGLVLIICNSACKKDQTNTDPDKPKVSSVSLELSDSSKLFNEPFNGKKSGEVYVSLIPQVGAFSGELVLRPKTEPAQFTASMKFLVKNDDGTNADTAIYELTGNHISFSKIGTYRISGFVPATDKYEGSDTTREIRIQVASNVPDDEFRTQLKAYRNSINFVDEILDTTTAVNPGFPENFVVVNYNMVEIQSVEGLNFFKNIRRLECVGKSKLTTLNIDKLTKLQNLVCTYSAFGSVDLRSNTKLTYVSVENSYGLGSLNVTNLALLVDLRVNNCNLTSIDLTGVAKLFNFHCGSNPLLALDLKDMAELFDLDCSNTLVSDLDVTNLHNLYMLKISDCSLTRFAFDTVLNSNPGLTYLTVSHAFKCDSALKVIKQYRGKNLNIELSDISSGLANINEYDPLVSCPR